MRTFVTFLIFAACSTADLALALSTPRTIKDIPEAREALRRTTSPKFYQSLLISPMEGWITVRGIVAGDRLVAPKLVRSDLGGAYDDLALELANNLKIHGFNTAQQQTAHAALLHVLLYRIADGKLAVSFANLEDAGTHMRHVGAAWMAVHKETGEWVTIEPRWHPPGERRGPRSYGLFVREPGARGGFRGVGILVQRPH